MVPYKVPPTAAAPTILARMRRNPRDWRIEDLKTVARRWGIEVDQGATSHVVFATQGQVGFVSRHAGRLSRYTSDFFRG